jgi:hypothetical protein
MIHNPLPNDPRASISSRPRLWPSRGHLPAFHGSQHLFGRVKSTDSAFTDILQSFGDLCIDAAALFRGVFVICRWQLRNNSNQAARNSVLKLISALDTSTPLYLPPYSGMFLWKTR